MIMSGQPLSQWMDNTWYALMTCLVAVNMQFPMSHTSLPSCFRTRYKHDHAAGKLLGFEFQRDAVMLASCPFPELEDCMGTALSPEKLLQQLTSRGLPLLVPPAAVAAAGLTCKVRPETTDKHRCRPPSVNQPVLLTQGFLAGLMGN